MMHQMNQRSGEHALILDALRNAYAEFHDPNGIALSRNRVLRSRPDRGSTPITRNKVCIKPASNPMPLTLPSSQVNAFHPGKMLQR